MGRAPDISVAVATKPGHRHLLRNLTIRGWLSDFRRPQACAARLIASFTLRILVPSDAYQWPQNCWLASRSRAVPLFRVQACFSEIHYRGQNMITRNFSRASNTLGLLTLAGAALAISGCGFVDPTDIDDLTADEGQ